jgi:hypothetical protein
MNKYDFFKKTAGNRDSVFNYLIDNFFKEMPINILEIGCLRDASEGSRRGDGWSDFHWIDYQDKYGGNLTICDISQNNLDVSSSLISNFPRIDSLSVNFLCEDGFKVIKDSSNYDFYYLDGGDNPYESLDQFEAIPKNKIILIDDAHTKGVLIRDKYKNYICFGWKNHDHKMVLYSPDIKEYKEIILDQIE